MTFLQRTNAVLRRLGKTQTNSTDFPSAASDSWPGLVKEFLKEAELEIWKEHDWSTLMTSGTISSTSDRTVNLASSFSDFGRAIDLTSTTHDIVLEPCSLLDIDADDPDLDDEANPTRYHIAYPNLLFNRTPSSETFRFRYVKRPTVPTLHSSTSDLPEFCDLPQVMYAYWQLQATREDAEDGGTKARQMYLDSLARAIGQDKRRTDRLFVYQSVFPDMPRRVVPFPSNYAGY